MLFTTHYNEADAMKHSADLQIEGDRFVAITENINAVGEWIVAYDSKVTKIDREALRKAQAIV